MTLEINEVGDGGQLRVELVLGEHHGESRLGRDHGIPGLNRVGVGQDVPCFLSQQRGQHRVELLPAALAGQADRCLHPADMTPRDGPRGHPVLRPGG